MTVFGTMELVPDTNQIILTIENFNASEPKPIDPYLLNNYIGYNYDNHVAVRTDYLDDGTIKTTIKTMPGTGRGQLGVFEDLVGLDIASQRPDATQRYAQIDINASNMQYIRSKIADHIDDTGDPAFFVPDSPVFVYDYEGVYQGVQVDIV